jgi:NAD(P)-dependent dehydrogenase (short-subunit alcohol dehydrogenase family)
MARAPAEVAPSPLAEIEAQVQARAKDLTLDLGAGPDRESLRRLVEGAIADWGAEHKRGLRPHDLSSPTVVADRVLRNLVGYGPLDPLLADDDVWEIMVRRYADLPVCPKPQVNGPFVLTARDRTRPCFPFSCGADVVQHERLHR